MKIVIWGHKLHSHTHSYIHYGYWRAADHLGHEVHWYDDSDDVSSVDFSNSVFITEHQVWKRCLCVQIANTLSITLTNHLSLRGERKYEGLLVYNFVHDAKYWHYGPDYVYQVLRILVEVFMSIQPRLS